ncbi:MAG: ATP-binding protein [Clostridia bacterium]|nr:ATP-binding protein [Clostridia bacterium]
MEIKRDKYLNDLIIRMGNGLVKVITGIRRCGKSYLMNNLFYDWLLSNGADSFHIIKFAFDSADDLELIGEDLFELERKKQKVDPKKFMSYIRDQITDDEKYYLLLDEIQNLGSFESVLNGYLRKKNLDLYVTGSNSRFLSSDILTEFEGRGDEIHVLPLSFSEYASAFSGSREEAYEQYSMFGGLPLLFSMKTDEQKTKHLISQAENVYIRDVISRNNLRDSSDVGELLDVLASGISSFTNPTKIEATFKSVKRSSITRVTIDRYIEYFTDAFMIKKAKKYDIKGRKYIQTPFKIYFEDIGIRNARIGFRQIEPTHIMENIVYNELRYRGYEVDVGAVESRERENGKDVRKVYEIDFVATLGSKKYYIQSAYDIPGEEKWLQETRSFDKVADSFKKIVLVRNPVISHYSDKGYFIMGLLDFLMNENSLEL